MVERLRWIRYAPRMVLYNLIMYTIDAVTIIGVLIVFVIDPVSDTMRLRFGIGWFGVLVGWAVLRSLRSFIGFLRTWEIDMQLRVLPDWRDKSITPSTESHHER